MPVAIKLTLYDPKTNEVIHEHTQLFVPWKLLKKAIQVEKEIDNLDDMSDETVDAVAALVVETFGNKFTVDELDNGADLGEMFSVVNQIIAVAKNANPTHPGS